MIGTAIRIASGVLLCGALLLGCSEDAPAGCVIDTVVLDQCLRTSQCPDCTAVCEDRGGTRVGGPACDLFIGFGFFCTCACEFCFETDGGSTDGGGGVGGDANSSSRLIQ